MADTLKVAIPGSDGPSYDEDYNELKDSEETNKNEKDEESEEEKEEVDNTDASEEDEEDSEDSEDEDEDEEEPVKIPFSRPSVKEIKAKYPEFFTDFPDIKESIFREAEFTKLFPTVEDAREAFNDNDAFTVLSDAALAGDPSPIIESLEKTDPKALAIFAGSFLPQLYKRNQQIYSDVVTPIFEAFFRQVYKEGDENTKNSAHNLAVYLFGEDGEASVTGKKTVSKINEITEQQKKLKEETENKNATAFREASAYISDECFKSMRVLVLQDFDPNHVFTKTVRSMLVDEIIKRIDTQLNADKGHETVMGARWKRARASGFSNDERSKIISTYLARAKSLIPTVRDKVRRDALGKSVKNTEERTEKVKRSVSPKEVNGGRFHKENEKSTKDYSKMSDIDILNS